MDRQYSTFNGDPLFTGNILEMIFKMELESRERAGLVFYWKTAGII
jgi:hypothetical protein